MSEEQIIELIEKYFIELNPFSGITPKEYGGRLDTFVKFAEKLYNRGKYDGYDHGYSSAKFGSKFDDLMGW